MKEIVISIGTLAAALAIAAAVVFAWRDPALFVPPPESVAEDFARKLGNRRYGLAREHLSRTAREHQSALAIEKLFEPVKSRIGALEGVEATELSRDGDRASAECELRGQHGAVTLRFALVREQGLWVIDSWSLGELGVRSCSLHVCPLRRTGPGRVHSRSHTCKKQDLTPGFRRLARAGWRRKTAGYRQVFST